MRAGDGVSSWPLRSPSKRIAVDVVDLVRLVGGSQRGDERRARSLVCYEVLVVPEWLRTADYALAYGGDNGFGNGEQGGPWDDEQGGPWGSGQGGSWGSGQGGAGADLRSAGVSGGDVEPGPSTPPPDSAFYLHEAVLHTPVGGPGAHARQLLALAASPWPVRVVPFGVGARPALARPFVYLEFADAPPVAYSGGRVESAGPHREALAVLEELALGVDASRALLATWKTAAPGPFAGRGAACTSDTPDSH